MMGNPADRINYQDALENVVSYLAQLSQDGFYGELTIGLKKGIPISAHERRSLRIDLLPLRGRKPGPNASQPIPPFQTRSTPDLLRAAANYLQSLSSQHFFGSVTFFFQSGAPVYSKSEKTVQFGVLLNESEFLAHEKRT